MSASRSRHPPGRAGRARRLGAALEGLPDLLQGRAVGRDQRRHLGAAARSGRADAPARRLSWTARSIGIAHYLFHRSCWTIGDYCYLQDLFVAEEARGLGAGRALIAAVESEARAAGASRVYWLTQEDNTTARALYDKVADRSGFIQYRKLF